MEVEQAAQDAFDDAVDDVSLTNAGGCTAGGRGGLGGLAALFTLGLGALRRRRR